MTEENTQENSENQAQPEQLSEEQLLEIRKRMIKYYKDKIGVLEPQAKYETLLADIEEARARRMQMSIRLAQMMAGPKEPEKRPEGPQAPDNSNSQQS